MSEAMLNSLLRVAITLIVVVVLNGLLRSLIRVPKKLDTKRSRTYLAVVRNIITIALFLIGAYISSLLLHIDLAPLVTSLGIVGLIIGIGARSVIEDFISGFFLLTQGIFAIGDYVRVGNDEGVIADIGFRTITIRGLDGAIHIVPNGEIKQVVNYSLGQNIMYIDIPVKAGQDIDVVMKALEKVLQSLQEDKTTDYQIFPESKVQGIEDIKVGNGIFVRVMIVSTSRWRDILNKEYRYRVIKEFEKNKLLFA